MSVYFLSVTLNKFSEKLLVASATWLLTAVFESAARDRHTVPSRKQRVAETYKCWRNYYHESYVL